ncbi:hypothetical protein HOD38_05045 [archaeon]|jgi:hypothetical protein|nr:hypothetical protein [archaeon]MBT4397607.1 hypothetical protein [archaeon]MBT4441094.1 hypothetical protein [archaeon]
MTWLKNLKKRIIRSCIIVREIIDRLDKNEKKRKEIKSLYEAHDILALEELVGEIDYAVVVSRVEI